MDESIPGPTSKAWAVAFDQRDMSEPAAPVEARSATHGDVV
jgi:hypothetical protein